MKKTRKVFQKTCKNCGDSYKSYGLDHCSGLCNSCCTKRNRQRRNKRETERLKTKLPKWEVYKQERVRHELKTKDFICCAECGTYITNVPEVRGMAVAHIVSGAERPDLYYLMENTIFLCPPCHMELDRGAGWDTFSIVPSLREAKKIILDNWEELMRLPHNLRLSQKLKQYDD